jgi:LysR family transcriptional regulator, transcriptional activator for dmlA
MNANSSNALVQPADLGFFSTLATSGSLTAAARELGVTTPAVSRRLAQMESRIGVALVNRSTRRMSLTPEGELYLEHARNILGEIDALSQALGRDKATPKGLLRVNATLGFGRSHVAPIIGRFVRRYPLVDAQLQLSVNPPSIADDAFDVCVRFGEPPDARIIARRIAPNRRLLCAAPSYLARRGTPRTPRDLTLHNCIGIRQGEEAHGVWKLSSGRGGNRRIEPVKVRGNLVTNDGEIAVHWALEGAGILMRAEWDIERHLRGGRLVQVLAQYDTPDADIFAVYPQRHQHSTRVRAFADFLEQSLKRFLPASL